MSSTPQSPAVPRELAKVLRTVRGSTAKIDPSYEDFIYAADKANQDCIASGLDIRGKFKISNALPSGLNPTGATNTLIQVFQFYAKIRTSFHSTFSAAENAVNSLSFTKFEIFCRDFQLIPKLLTRDDLKLLWEDVSRMHAQTGHGTLTMIDFTQFRDLLIRMALWIYHKPGLKKLIIILDGFMPKSTQIIQYFTTYLGLHDADHIATFLRTVGRKTQGDLNMRSKGEVNLRTKMQMLGDANARKYSALPATAGHTAGRGKTAGTAPGTAGTAAGGAGRQGTATSAKMDAFGDKVKESALTAPATPYSVIRHQLPSPTQLTQQPLAAAGIAANGGGIASAPMTPATHQAAHQASGHNLVEVSAIDGTILYHLPKKHGSRLPEGLRSKFAQRSNFAFYPHRAQSAQPGGQEMQPSAGVADNNPANAALAADNGGIGVNSMLPSLLEALNNTSQLQQASSAETGSSHSNASHGGGFVPYGHPPPVISNPLQGLMPGEEEIELSDDDDEDEGDEDDDQVNVKEVNGHHGNRKGSLHHGHHAGHHGQLDADSQSLVSVASSQVSVFHDPSLEALRESYLKDYEDSRLLQLELARYCYEPPMVVSTEWISSNAAFLDLGLLSSGHQIKICLRISNGCGCNLHLDVSTRQFHSDDTHVSTFSKAMVTGLARDVMITFTVPEVKQAIAIADQQSAVQVAQAAAMNKLNVLCYVDILCMSSAPGGHSIALTCPVYYRIDPHCVHDTHPVCTIGSLPDLLGQMLVNKQRKLQLLAANNQQQQQQATANAADQQADQEQLLQQQNNKHFSFYHHHHHEDNLRRVTTAFDRQKIYDAWPTASWTTLTGHRPQRLPFTINSGQPISLVNTGKDLAAATVGSGIGIDLYANDDLLQLQGLTRGGSLLRTGSSPFITRPVHYEMKVMTRTLQQNISSPLLLMSTPSVSPAYLHDLIPRTGGGLMTLTGGGITGGWSGPGTAGGTAGPSTGNRSSSRKSRGGGGGGGGGGLHLTSTGIMGRQDILLLDDLEDTAGTGAGGGGGGGPGSASSRMSNNNASSKMSNNNKMMMLHSTGSRKQLKPLYSTN